MPQPGTACGTCRVRKKNEDCHPDYPGGDCTTCLRLNLECLRRYGERISPRYRNTKIPAVIKAWTKKPANRLSPTPLSLTALAANLPAPLPHVRRQSRPTSHGVVPSHSQTHTIGPVGGARNAQAAPSFSAHGWLEVPHAHERTGPQSDSGDSLSVSSYSTMSHGSPEVVSGCPSPFEVVEAPQAVSSESYPSPKLTPSRVTIEAPSHFTFPPRRHVHYGQMLPASAGPSADRTYPLFSVRGDDAYPRLQATRMAPPLAPEVHRPVQATLAPLRFESQIIPLAYAAGPSANGFSAADNRTESRTWDSAWLALAPPAPSSSFPPTAANDATRSFERLDAPTQGQMHAGPRQDYREPLFPSTMPRHSDSYNYHHYLNANRCAAAMAGADRLFASGSTVDSGYSPTTNHVNSRLNQMPSAPHGSYHPHNWPSPHYFPLYQHGDVPNLNLSEMNIVQGPPHVGPAASHGGDAMAEMLDVEMPEIRVHEPPLDQD